MDIKSIQDEIIDEFQFLTDWNGRFEHIIAIGDDLEKYPEAYQDEAHEIKGCRNRLFFHYEVQDGKLHFFAHSDARIPKGVVALILRVLSDQTPEDIVKANLYFLESIGLPEALSMLRSNVLEIMVKKIKSIAVEHLPR
jgi:cysteine desulfuration protein SufE